jgi:hypothetical protein
VDSIANAEDIYHSNCDSVAIFAEMASMPIDELFKDTMSVADSLKINDSTKVPYSFSLIAWHRITTGYFTLDGRDISDSVIYKDGKLNIPVDELSKIYSPKYGFFDWLLSPYTKVVGGAAIVYGIIHSVFH